MGKNKIAIFGVGGNIGRGLIPLLLDADYDKFKVMAQKDETRSFMMRDDVIFRGDYYLERDVVIDAMKGCKKVMLALPRTLKRLELIGYAKFIGECAVAARIPTLIRLAVADYDTKPATNEDEENFRLLDEYLDTLAIEVVTIQSGTMVSGKWSTPKINRRRKQQQLQKAEKEKVSTPTKKTATKKKSPSKKTPTKKNTSKNKGEADDFIGLSVTFDSTSEEASPPDAPPGGGQSAATSDTSMGALWNMLAAGMSRSPSRTAGRK